MAENKKLLFYVAGTEGDNRPQYYDEFNNAFSYYLNAETDGKEIGFCLNADHVAMSRYSETNEQYSIFFPEEVDMHKYLSNYALDEEKTIISEAQSIINNVLSKENERLRESKNVYSERSNENNLKSPVRYRFDENGKNPQRLWHGKTVEEFNEYDTIRFMVETDMSLHGGILSDSARKMLNEAGFEYVDGHIVEKSISNVDVLNGNKESHFQFKGFAYVPGKREPYILYDESPEAIIKKLQDKNKNQQKDNQFKHCNIGQKEPEGKYSGYHKYDVTTGKDISSIYLTIPPMNKDDFKKVIGYLKENGARYNTSLKRWYVNPEYTDISKFKEYLSPKAEHSAENSKLQFSTEADSYNIELQYCLHFKDGRKIHLGTKELGKPINELTAGEAVTLIEKAIISENIRNAGYKPTEQLVDKYQEFNEITGKSNTISDVCSAFKSGEYADDPEINGVLKDIGKLFQQQEVVKQANITEMVGEI